MTGENEWTDYEKTDEELIADAIADGKLRKVPAGEGSGWWDLTFVEKRKRLFNRKKKEGKKKCTTTKR